MRFLLNSPINKANPVSDGQTINWYATKWAHIKVWNIGLTNACILGWESNATGCQIRHQSCKQNLSPNLSPLGSFLRSPASARMIRHIREKSEQIRPIMFRPVSSDPTYHDQTCVLGWESDATGRPFPPHDRTATSSSSSSSSSSSLNSIHAYPLHS